MALLYSFAGICGRYKNPLYGIIPAKVGIKYCRGLENVFHLCMYVHSYPATVINTCSIQCWVVSAMIPIPSVILLILNQAMALSVHLVFELLLSRSSVYMHVCVHPGGIKSYSRLNNRLNNSDTSNLFTHFLSISLMSLA